MISRLPEATGFIWKRHEHYYLITNWHVVSALDLFTNMHLLKAALDRTNSAAISSSVSESTGMSQ